MSRRKTGLPTSTPTAGNNFCRPVPLITYSAINEGAQCHKVRALALGDGIDGLCGEKRSLTVTRGAVYQGSRISGAELGIDSFSVLVDGPIEVAGSAPDAKSGIALVLRTPEAAGRHRPHGAHS